MGSQGAVVGRRENATGGSAWAAKPGENMYLKVFIVIDQLTNLLAHLFYSSPG